MASFESFDSRIEDGTIINFCNHNSLPASRESGAQNPENKLHPLSVKTQDSLPSGTRQSDPKPQTIILIKERNFRMLKNDLILRNPLRLMGHESEDILKQGQFGAVLARAGVGKTALLVQLSLNSLLQGKNVLHISLQDPVNKVSVWYKEVLNRISQQYNVNQIDQLWDAVQPHRFIMTFRVEGFTVPRLEERLTDLMEQDIFVPQMMLIDGLPFDDGVQESLLQLKTVAQKYAMHAWFTVRTHRHEMPDQNGLPVQLAHVADLFEVALQLIPEGKQIHVKTLKAADPACDHPDLVLDPATMLIQNQ
jgi:hypothetical protein